jgi:hypothetical protein
MSQPLPFPGFLLLSNPRKSGSTENILVPRCRIAGNQDELILVVGVHVLNDLVHGVSQRVGLAAVYSEAVTHPSLRSRGRSKRPRRTIR